jgi:hypothetical protein
MKASELRIGNYVNIHNVITSIDVADFHFNSSFIKPIPITVEWLLKLGFEYYSFDKNYVIKNKDGYCNSIKNNDGEWCYNNDISDANYSIRELKYIHQLQNLYFALNEEELTIK